MTLQDLDKLLKTVCPDTFEFQAPPKKNRFLTWHRYGSQSTCGDDRNLLDLPKVQIDILTQSTTDDLVDEVCGVLGANGLTYEILDNYLYDPDYNGLRTVLQLVVI